MNERNVAMLERLFLRHQGALQAFFRRRIRTATDAPDLAQEVYLRMLGVKDADSIRNPEFYLYTVANNLVKEQAVVERRRRTSDDIDDQSIQEQLAELPQFDGQIDSVVRNQRLHEVLEQLTPKCRAAVVLQYRDGLSYREIGEVLGVSSHMVKKYLSQALVHCRRRMERLK